MPEKAVRKSGIALSFGQIRKGDHPNFFTKTTVYILRFAPRPASHTMIPIFSLRSK